MTALYIIVGILLFLFLLLMIPVSLRFKFDGEPELVLQYSFIKIKLVPPKEKPEKQKSEPSKPEKQAEAKSHKKDNRLKKLYQKRGLDGLLEIISEVFSIIKDTSKKLLKYMVIKDLKIDLLIVGDDAADTAVKYGYACAVIYPAVSFVDSNMKLRKREIDISAGFNEKETKAFAKARIGIRPLFALGAVLSGGFRGIKLILGLKNDMED